MNEWEFLSLNLSFKSPGYSFSGQGRPHISAFISANQMFFYIKQLETRNLGSMFPQMLGKLSDHAGDDYVRTRVPSLFKMQSFLNFCLSTAIVMAQPTCSADRVSEDSCPLSPPHPQPIQRCLEWNKQSSYQDQWAWTLPNSG